MHSNNFSEAGFVDFSSVFVHQACFHAFSTIFRRFFSKNRWKINEKNDTFFRIVACFFQHGDPHETLYFTIRKLLFHFSCFFIFSTKIIKNRWENTVPKHDQKMMVWASILGPKIDENRRRKARKALKL